MSVESVPRNEHVAYGEVTRASITIREKYLPALAPELRTEKETVHPSMRSVTLKTYR
jgi:hypothetical protein